MVEKYQLVSVDGEDTVALDSDRAVVYVENSSGLPEPMEWTSYELRNDPKKNGTLEVESTDAVDGMVPWTIPSFKHAVIYADRDDVRILGLDG